MVVVVCGFFVAVVVLVWFGLVFSLFGCLGASFLFVYFWCVLFLKSAINC